MKAFKIDPMLTVTQVAKLLGMSRSSVYLLLKTGDFPRGYKISEKTRRWKQSEVENWLKKRKIA